MTWWQDRLKNGSWTPKLASIERAEMDRACSMPEEMAFHDFFLNRFLKAKKEDPEEKTELCQLYHSIASNTRERIVKKYYPGQLGHLRGVEVHPLLSHDMTDYQIRTAALTANELIDADVPLGYDYTVGEELCDGKSLVLALKRDNMTDVEKQEYTV